MSASNANIHNLDCPFVFSLSPLRECPRSSLHPRPSRLARRRRRLPRRHSNRNWNLGKRRKWDREADRNETIQIDLQLGSGGHRQRSGVLLDIEAAQVA
jgi:hypothetical protein